MTASTHLARSLQNTSVKRTLSSAMPKDPTMHADTPLYAREDTMLGVCEGLGQELGIHANWLRVALLLALFWNPVAVFVGYLALGVALAAFRWAFPLRRAAVATPTAAPALRGDNDDALIGEAAAA
jgi:phage shock protein C